MAKTKVASTKTATVKAAKAAKAQTAGTRRRVKKVYTDVSFHRPRTLRLPGHKLYARKAIPRDPLDKHLVIKAPVFTDAAMKEMEKNNTLTFLCDPRANKQHIAKAIFDLYQVKAVRVNTLIRPDGQKKAYIKLDANTEALDVANRIGLI